MNPGPSGSQPRVMYPGEGSGSQPMEPDAFTQLRQQISPLIEEFGNLKYLPVITNWTLHPTQQITNIRQQYDNLAYGNPNVEQQIRNHLEINKTQQTNRLADMRILRYYLYRLHNSDQAIRNEIAAALIGHGQHGQGQYEQGQQEQHVHEQYEQGQQGQGQQAQHGHGRVRGGRGGFVHGN
uniref:SXP/RAL-2 family protein Ani s 5-like cation-binding domain-containing protein n=1 Tax=Meloidogyne javanica TaxID=6303 RepID=A0A915MWL2_MELJA